MRALIRPGELLLRRTRTEFTLSRGDEPLRRRVELSELWIDGSSPSRQIERITDEEGRLQSVILTARDRAGAGWRYNTPDFGRRYFSASDQTRLRNTLEIPPGLEALQAAAAQLRSEDRARVEWIRTQTLPDGLARQRHLNRSLFSFSSRSEQGTNFLPQVTRLEQVDTARGEPIYRVETLTQRALWGDPALGPSDQQPGKLTGVRDISRENYLTAKYDRRIERDDGSVVRMVSETLELRATPKASLDDPFAFEAPATARRVERAALEETRRLAEALRSLGLRLPPA